MDDEVLQLVPEDLRLVLVGEVAVLDAPRGHGVDHPVGHLTQRPLTLIGVGGATEVLLGQDVGGVEAPALGHLDVQLLEGHGSVPVVRDPGVASLPHDLVVGVDTGGGEVTANADADALWSNGHVVILFLDGRWCGLLLVRWVLLGSLRRVIVCVWCCLSAVCVLDRGLGSHGASLPYRSASRSIWSP